MDKFKYVIGLASIICYLLLTVDGYYERHKCFGTGDCILSTAYHAGGYNDEYNRWLSECNDGEAIIGIYDAVRGFIGIEQIWCKFMFPLKPPSRGIYPFYSQCNVRNQTMQEYYCYDKYYPKDTSNTFAVALFTNVFQDPGVPQAMKCCKTPAGYYIDYNRCQWKYTHDKQGEHYDGYWLVKCESDHVMTGLGQAIAPNDGLSHFVWIQCCPVVYGGIPVTDGYRSPPMREYSQGSGYSAGAAYGGGSGGSGASYSAGSNYVQK